MIRNSGLQLSIIQMLEARFPRLCVGTTAEFVLGCYRVQACVSTSWVLKHVGQLILAMGVSRPDPFAKRTNSLVVQVAVPHTDSLMLQVAVPHAILPSLSSAVDKSLLQPLAAERLPIILKAQSKLMWLIGE
jgi:hypothetical protein